MLSIPYSWWKRFNASDIEVRDRINDPVNSEIIKVLEFHDVALNLVESRLDERMSDISNQIRDNLATTSNLEKINLENVQVKLGMNPIMEDIYVINRNGIVVNTTFKDDMLLDFFSFGEEHKNLLLNIFEDGLFHSERFAIENKTKRIKKYTYQ